MVIRARRLQSGVQTPRCVVISVHVLPMATNSNWRAHDVQSGPDASLCPVRGYYAAIRARVLAIVVNSNRRLAVSSM